MDGGDDFNSSIDLDLSLAELRKLLSAEVVTDDEDLIREQYSQLLEVYGDDPEALARIRPIGSLINERVERGQMARAFVRRSPSRHD